MIQMVSRGKKVPSIIVGQCSSIYVLCTNWEQNDKLREDVPLLSCTCLLQGLYGINGC